MKKTLTIALAVLGIGFSSLTLADHGRRDYYPNRHHGEHYRGDYHGKKHAYKHWKKHQYQARHYDRRYYGPRYQERHVVHHYDDDYYKWVGGIYLLNEVIHHNRH